MVEGGYFVWAGRHLDCFGLIRSIPFAHHWVLPLKEEPLIPQGGAAVNPQRVGPLQANKIPICSY